MKYSLPLCLFLFIPWLQIAYSGHHLSTYPFISDMTFMNIVDREHNLAATQPGEIVYEDNLSIEHFFQRKHPIIPNPYILISHGGWHSVPGNFAKFLEDPKLIAWFGKNAVIKHPKLHQLPIGIPNRAYCDVDSLIQTIKNAVEPTKRRTDKLVYLNMTIGCNPKERNAALKLKNKEFSTYSDRVSQKQYFTELAQHRFVASPNGLGIDCHRTWEALLVGTIPIVTKSPITALFDDLPVLIIEDWNQITREFLEEKFVEITSKSYNLEKLYADYWFNKIREVQRDFRGQR